MTSGLVFGWDVALPGSPDYTSFAALCPLCRTLYTVELEPDQTLVAVQPCECTRP